MEANYRELMAGKSDINLQKYIDQKEKYTPEAVEYAITEMQKRGRIFSDEEIVRIRQEIQLKKEADEAEEKEALKEMDANVVTDNAAPAYYSQTTIYAFGIIFSVLFGAVLLAINMDDAGAKKGARQVMIYGILYSIFQITMIWIMFMEVRTGMKLRLAVLIGALGILFMNELFWRKYIGEDTKYRVKPIWKPLIIGLAIWIPLICAVIYERG